MQKAIKELLKLNIKTSNDLMAAKRKIAKKYGINILENSEILKYLKNVKSPQPPLAKGENYKKSPSPLLSKGLIRILRKRAIRTMSGIAPVAVLTKPYPCPGKCAYCPTEKDVPQSVVVFGQSGIARDDPDLPGIQVGPPSLCYH